MCLPNAKCLAYILLHFLPPKPQIDYLRYISYIDWARFIQGVMLLTQFVAIEKEIKTDFCVGLKDTHLNHYS